MPASRITPPRLLATLCIALLTLAPPQALAQPADGEPTTFTLAEEAFRRGDFTQAVDLFQQARAEGIDHAFLHFHLGYALHVLGRIDEALPHHLRGASINNREVRIDCIYNAACAHALLGRTDNAIRYLQHAIDAGFADKEQAAKDTDLDTIRDDPRFGALIAGIGVEPTLFEQLDFMLGRWEMRGDDGGVIHYAFERPHDRSAAMAYQVSGRTIAWAGAIVPNPIDRTWELTYCNDLGTTYRFVGTFDNGSVVFRGRAEDVGGPGVHVRVTYSPGEQGSIVERAEVSEDAQDWREHHEVTLTPAADAGGT